MRTLFINPPNSPFTEKSLLIEPIDTLVLASYIETLGHDVEMLDMDVKKMNPDSLVSKLESFCPEVLVIVFDYHIPLHTSEALEGVLEIAKLAKKRGVKVVTGGKVSSFLPHKVIYKDSGVDVAIHRDMELALRALLNLSRWDEKSLSSIKGISFLKQGTCDQTEKGPETLPLDELPKANRTLVDLEDYIDVRTILSSRGCFMRCKFCHVPGAWGNWRARSPKNVVDEIESLVQNHDAKKILFLDDNTTTDKNRMIEISNLILKRQVKVKLGCLGTIVAFDGEAMEKMYEAGFRWIHYGIESGDDQLLKRIGKRTNAEQIEEVVKKTKSIGFRVRTSWIMDLPGTTTESVDRTIDLILRLQADEIRLHFLSIRMGSQYYEDYGKNDLTQQYIHNKKSNVRLGGIPYDYIQESTRDLAQKLSDIGYTIVTDPQSFGNLEEIRRGNPGMKIVSFCPLRYGLNWEK